MLLCRRVVVRMYWATESRIFFKTMVFWTTGHTRAKKGHEFDELMIIKLFRGNYARELLQRINNIFYFVNIRKK
jgi:hypothetical protein